MSIGIERPLKGFFKVDLRLVAGKCRVDMSHEPLSRFLGNQQNMDPHEGLW